MYATQDAPSPPASSARFRPLHVLDVTDFYSETSSGGVKTYLEAKAAAFASLGIRHTIVVPGSSSGAESLGESRIHRIAGRSLPMAPAYRIWTSGRELGRIIDECPPDLIEVGSPFIVPRLLRRIPAARQIPKVGFYHADIVRTFAEPYVPNRLAAPLRVTARVAARWMVRRVYTGFDATVGTSRSVVEELRGLGVPNVHQVPLGVDLELFRSDAADREASRADWGIPDPGVPVGIYVGRFCAEKRLDVLLDGHARLPLPERPYLVLVGGGPLEVRVRRVAQSQKRLVVRPYERDRQMLARAYASADFYVAPGPGETFGLAIGEALASGLPVVSVGRGGGPDRIRGTDVGELYGHGDPVSAAEALRRLVGRLSPLLRARARAHAEATLAWRVTFDMLVRLYREVLEGRVRP